METGPSAWDERIATVWPRSERADSWRTGRARFLTGHSVKDLLGFASFHLFGSVGVAHGEGGPERRESEESEWDSHRNRLLLSKVFVLVERNV